MSEIWQQITAGFMPHGYCLRWNGPLLFMFIAGNLGIAVAYFYIPLALRYFVSRRRDLPYSYMFQLFALFIASCALTHVAQVWTIYQPAYWIEAGLDLWAAIVSLTAAALLTPLIPRALVLRSPSELDAANKKLQQVTEELQAAKDSLEGQVQARTAEWQAATKKAQEAETFFRQLFDSMPQLGWTARADGYIDFYNRGWYEYTGMTFEQIKGWGWESVHDADLLPGVKERWLAAIKSGAPTELRFPLRRADGELRWFLTRINPVPDADGKVVRWIGINTDIQKEVEQADALETMVHARTAELQMAKETAENALQTKNRFLATVSHEVRTPLSGIIGLAELLTLQDLGESNNATAKMILDSSRQLMRILNDVLDAAKLSEGKLSIEKRKFAPSGLLYEVARLLRPDAEKKGLRLWMDIDEQTPEFVMGDEFRVRQILLNLGFNAVKFTSSGGITVAMRPQEGAIHFEVRDTGIGISQEKISKIFEPFEQAQQSVSREYGGTGLGLAISKNLVELMGGKIGVISQVGKGSIFWFEIPFDAA
jgi:PAS domain S-box-containing protein